MKKETYKIIIDNTPFDYESQFITGLEVKQLIGVPLEYGVWLKQPGPESDIEIQDEEQVDLSKPGRERFFTGPKQTTEGI